MILQLINPIPSQDARCGYGIYKEKKMNTNNTSSSGDVSLRTVAIVAGLGLLLMSILAPIVQFNIFQNLVASGNGKTTVDNILASIGTFRIGIVSFLIVAILDIVVAWALYILLKPVNQSLSLLAAWFRVVYSAIFVVALVNLLSVLQLLTGAGFSGFDTAPQIMLSLDAFQSGWDMGYVIFGLHLVVLGFLVFKSGYIPKWLGILLFIAGLGYMVDSIGKFLLPGYNVIISLYTFIGEPLLTIWLLWKGIKGFDKSLEQNS